MCHAANLQPRGTSTTIVFKVSCLFTISDFSLCLVSFMFIINTWNSIGITCPFINNVINQKACLIGNN